jgi:hypothetical protein
MSILLLLDLHQKAMDLPYMREKKIVTVKEMN